MRKLLILIGGVAALLGAAAPAQAVEPETHIFDATLSLTGGCSTAAVDPVPDPGPCPGEAGVDHPQSGPFQRPRGLAIDAYGNRYVSTLGDDDAIDNGDRVAVFDPEGFFITELDDLKDPAAVAVDSKGNLYVIEIRDASGKTETMLYRYEPSVYAPEAGEIEYGKAPVFVAGPGLFGANGGVWKNGGLVVNPLNDRVFHSLEQGITEYGSAAEGNLALDTFGKGLHVNGHMLAMDAAHGKIYATHNTNNVNPALERMVVRAFNLNAPHELLGTIDGSTTPAGKFTSAHIEFTVAVEEETGHVFVGDLGTAKKVYELEPDGSYVSTLAKNFLPLGWREIEVDNGPNSPARGTLFVPSGENLPGRSFAFKLIPTPDPPVIESLSFTGVTEEEAVLRAVVNPEGEATTYRFEYTTEASFEKEGFAAALLAGEGTLAPSAEGVSVSANLSSTMSWPRSPGVQPGVHPATAVETAETGRAGGTAARRRARRHDQFPLRLRALAYRAHRRGSQGRQDPPGYCGCTHPPASARSAIEGHRLGVAGWEAEAR